MTGSLLILAASLLTASGEYPRPAWVAVDRLEVFDSPDEAGFVTESLAKGDRVTVRRVVSEGWAAIDPPPGSFSLIDDNDIEDVDDTHARIIANFAIVHPGRDRARKPGAAHVTLRLGTVVRLLDRRPLVVRGGEDTRTLIAIVPPAEESRFVKSDDLLDGPPVQGDEEVDPRRRDALVSSISSLAGDRKRTKPAAIVVGAIDRDFTDVGAGSAEANLSPEFVNALASAESIHRQILLLPLDRWDLAPAKKAYQGLLSRPLATAERAAVDSRLERVDRQDAAARATRTMGSVLKKSRDRDPAIATLRRQVAESAVPETPEYDAQGLLQATAQIVNGRKLYALINPEGQVASYVLIPPGLTVGPLLARRVGVRGDSRYNANLRARLVAAKDIDPLGPKP